GTGREWTREGNLSCSGTPGRDGGRAGRLEGARGARAGSGVRERRGPASGGGGRKTPAGPGRDGEARGHGGQTAATQVGTRTLSPGMLDARGRRAGAGGAVGPDTADTHGTASRTMDRARPTAGRKPVNSTLSLG